MRTRGIPAEAGEVEYLFRNDQPLKNHPSYTDAKAGNLDAAMTLVGDLAEPLVEKTRRFGNETIYVAPHAIEASGENAIPQTLAVALAKAQSARHDMDIVQRNRVYHTGADAMQRLIAPSEFFGNVEADERYVLVDDVTTLGGTLADLASHILEHGGRVVGVVVLANASRSGKIIPAPHVVEQIKRRYGDDITDIFNISPDALTAEEAGYLIGFRDADELRNRAATAKQARVERLRSKGICLEAAVAEARPSGG
jgi:hypothetical protein